MRRLSNCCPHRFPWSSASWSPNNDLQLQPLPKPEAHGDDFDGVPFEEKIKEPNILIIRSVDPCFEENGFHHRTSKYELMRREYFPQLVVRRGQHFKLSITLSRPYDEERDGISFIFTVDDEDKPSHGNGTMVGVPLLKKSDRYLPWNVVLHSVDENIITVNVLTPSDTIVAKWRLDIDTRIIDNGAYSYSCETRIYILFNPWSKHDQVYMKSDEWREEAVINDVGIIYRGTYNRIKPVIWKYDHFEKDVLDCSLYLVHVIGKIRGNFRSDPVKITRALAAAVNAADDEGVVVGNWSTDLSGGTHPTKWMGSMEILQKYYKKKKPVKYAQCWVFSGVLATICRALGIPARTITNYSSAHDTQNSLTVDYFMDEKGAIMEELNSDSIWNFHVWNEVWMTRPDLGRQYAGWQAIDATPQEVSEDMYRCGPASVAAVKDGEILRPYDCNFLFAEVNADKIFWKYSGPTQPLKLLRKDIYGIGKLVITKAPGSFDKEDITSSYKYAEKTTEERTTMLKALRQSENLFARYYLNEDFNDIYFHFNLLDDVKIGQPFDVSLAMRNRSKTEKYRVSVILRVDVVTYTGKVGESVRKETFVVIVKPDSTHEVKLKVTYDEYSKRLIDQCSFNISCLASIEDTKFEYYAQDDFRIRKPDINIYLREIPVENTEVTADISVENPLPVPLKKGEFTIEAPGTEGKIKLQVKAVAPGENAKGEFKFTPPRTGTYALAAKFICKEMNDVDGFIMITVEPKKEQNETACEDINWIATLTKEYQMNIVVDLLSLGGGGLLRKLYIPIVIIYNKKVLEDAKRMEEYGDIDKQYFDQLFNEAHLDDSDKYQQSHPLSVEVEKMRKKWDEMMTKLRTEVFGWSDPTSQNVVPEKDAGDKKSKTQAKKKPAKSTAKSSSKNSKHPKHKGKGETDMIDWVQMLPIWIVKKIFDYLNPKTLKNLKNVNSYWSYASQSILNERQARAFLDKSIMKMRSSVDPQISRQFGEHAETLDEFYSPTERSKNPQDIRLVKMMNRGSILKQMVPVVDESQLVDSNLLTATIRQDKEKFSLVDGITVFPRLIREDLLLYKHTPCVLKDVNLVIDVMAELRRRRSTLEYSLSEEFSDIFSMSEANLADW